MYQVYWPQSSAVKEHKQQEMADETEYIKLKVKYFCRRDRCQF